jgi:hypothetical protein
MRKRIITLTVISLLLPTVLAEPVAAHHTKLETSRKKYKAILPDAYYDGLATCETGLDWKHGTLNYTGALGIARGTAWRWSGHRDIAKFSPRKQVEIADRIAFRGWDNPKTGQHKWRVGPWGWACLKMKPELQRYICASNHRLVQRWKRGC